MTLPNLNEHLKSHLKAEREAGYLLSEAVMLAMEDLEINAGHTNEGLHKATQVALEAVLLLFNESHRSHENFRLYIARLSELLPSDEREEMLSG